MENGKVIDCQCGWPVKQYLNRKVDRWYVTFSQNSQLARRLGRHRLLRSHYVYMKSTDTWEIPLGFVVHHKDHDRHNDHPGNLELMSETEHNRLHREFAALHGGSSFRGRRHKPETIEKMREVARARGNNDIWNCPKTHHFDETKTLMSERASGEGNPSYRADLSKEVVTEFYLRCRSLKETAENFGCSVNAVRYRLDPSLYQKKRNPLTGRERKYRFDDAEMVSFYEQHGARKAAEKYGCTEATIYYRVKAFRNENRVDHAAE